MILSAKAKIESSIAPTAVEPEPGEMGHDRTGHLKSKEEEEEVKTNPQI